MYTEIADFVHELRKEELESWCDVQQQDEFTPVCFFTRAG